MKPKRLFLLDAYALIFRGYYAFIKNPRINSKGLDTSAIMGFMNSLLDVIKREKPEYLAVAFDKGGSHSRVDLFQDYKANRLETPEAIRIAIPYIQELLKAMHIPIIEKEGIEADDLIGTLAKKAEKEGFDVYMVTPDKDYAQLVSPHIFMYRPARMGNGIEIWGEKEVREKFEVEHPTQVIDFLGMMGDAVDNIPGLPGVGEKTAKKFIAQYGSMENLFEHTHELKGKMKEKVEANKELGLLSKKLATILLDCPVEFHAESFYLDKPDAEKMFMLFQELEFRRMKDQFQQLFALEDPFLDADATKSNQKEEKKSNQSGNEGVQGSLFDVLSSDTNNYESVVYQNLERTPHLYQTIPDVEMLPFLTEILLKQKEVCFDLETTSIDVLKAELVGISFAFEKHQAYYVPFSEDAEIRNQKLALLQPFFENENIVKIGQNLKYDIKVLHKYQIQVKGALFDTMLAHYLINPDMRHNLDVLAETYLHYQPQPISDLIGKKGKNQLSLREVSLEEVKEYAGEDADITFQLKQILADELKKNDLEDLFQNIEVPLVQVLAEMELEGIRLDTAYLQKLSDDLEQEAAVIEHRIYETAGETFNIASPKQLGVILFEKLEINSGKKIKKTKTGQYATGEEILSELAKEHEIVRDILEWRQIIKLKNTYVDALPKQIDEQTKRIHTEYLQTVAATGRLSSNNPNLQNIPIRTERGQKVRRAFVARDEHHVLLAADYSQIELRIIAALSKEPNMIAAFENKEDIHRATAAKIFKVPLDEVTREQRSYAKTVNFGIIYGVSAFGLSQQTNLSRSESKELIEAYYETYPKLKLYIQEQIEFARANGYVQTVLGRRRYLKDIHSRNAVVRGAAERNAVNAPIQGSAADIIKLAMITIQQALKEQNFETKMLLQVHDELVFDVPKHEFERVAPLIKEKMEAAFQLLVPLEVEIGSGKNWLEAH